MTLEVCLARNAQHPYMDTTSTANNHSVADHDNRSSISHGKRGSPSHTPDEAHKKRRRPKRRASRLSKIDRWTLKAVSELRRFCNWMRSHQREDVLLYTTQSDALPTRPAHGNPSSPLEHTDGQFRVVLSVDVLPEIRDVVKKERLEEEKATDVSSYESDGCLLWMNFRIAERLVATRKNVRLSLTQGPWPASELLVNSAVVKGLEGQRYEQLTSDLISRILEVCRGIAVGTVIVFCRLGLEVARDERSLIVCATGVSADDAKCTAKAIWKRCLKLSFDSDVA